MVKAPRSKGCRVCVQRRIKCDQTRPHCLRCQKAARSCPGFETINFVDEGPSLRESYENSTIASSEDPPAGSLALAPPASSDNLLEVPLRKSRSLETVPKSGPSPFTMANWPQGSLEKLALVSFMAPMAYQAQLLSQFISSVRQPVLAPAYRCHSIWLAEIASMATPSNALVLALRAIATSHMGRSTGDDFLVQTSRRVYGKALLKLNAALQDEEEGMSIDTLGATMLLSFYEIFNCTEGNSWIKHAGGAGHLIKLRGPERHRTGIDRLVFVACRYSLVMEAFRKAIPCFLDAPEWRKLCRDISNDIRDKGSLIDTNNNYFHEIVTHPGYLHKAIDVVSQSQPNITKLRNIHRQGQLHRSRFKAIHDRMGEELRAAGQEPQKTASSFNDKQFPVVYEYPNIHVAAFYTGYWAVLCAINVSILALEAKLGPLYDYKRSPHDDSPVSTNQSKTQRRPLWEAAATLGDHHPYFIENAMHAREICKSAEYMANARFLGPFFLILALRTALKVLTGEDEKRWIFDKLTEVGQNMGLAKTEIEAYHVRRLTPDHTHA